MKISVEKIRLIHLIILCFLVLLRPVFSSDGSGTAAASSAEGPKFKIGFEFQEINNLCEWAANMFAIQKKPVFSVSRRGVKLWEVVIDGKDIEFVTEPFSNNQEDLLKDSIGTISMAFKFLCDFKNGRNPESITFNHWINGGELTAAERPLMGLSDARLATRQAPLRLIQKGLKRILEEGGVNVEINPAIFERIADLPFKGSGTPGGWRQEFQPQVTIQHPLESTIPLIMNLFNSSMRTRALTRGIEASKPALDASASTKADGLVFLHALTCTDLSAEVESDDKANIKWIADRFKEEKQIDGKVKLNFLSRRPFSNMWTDIKDASDLGFPELYEAKMSENALFKEVTEKMKFINYAEEFYNDDLSDRLNFSDLRGNVAPAFLTPDAEFLLSQGILTTSMLRHMNLPIMRGADASPSTLDTLFNDYFKKLIVGVERPLLRYEFDSESKTVQEKITPFDLLSPPWFLDGESDSMGAYKNNGRIDLSYGEAIVELRQIKEINNETIQAIKRIIVEELKGDPDTIDEVVVRGEFLVQNASLLNQANALFSLLKKIFLSKS